MKCFKCGKSPAQGTNLYRQNPKGEAGIWACAAHSKPVDDELVRIVKALSDMSLSAHQSAAMKNDEWLTPPEILRALGEFDLDPCAPVVRPWETATQHYTVDDNGLALPWAGRVWCNPPFGSEAVKWLARMRDHGNGIALIPARTETAMFYATIWGHAAGVLFMRGRPHFHYVDGRRAPFNSGAPIALVAYGERNLEALRASGLGFTVLAD